MNEMKEYILKYARKLLSLYFIERDAVFFVNETFGRLGNGDDFVG